VEFERELTAVLPEDLPHRADVIRKAAHHLELIVEANRHFNLTRITSPRDAAVKHVLDSVIPWRLFAGAQHLLDAGSGAGFPGIPLALVLPDTRFTLAESTAKKARFLDSVVKELRLNNAKVANARVEDLLRDQRPDAITARAVAPIGRAVTLFAPGLKPGVRALLYKGPDVQAEIAEADPELRKLGLRAHIIEAYELPDAAGGRTIVELVRAS
jgi:16S rRNA (guanine527-N7)-methyltransferase